MDRMNHLGIWIVNRTANCSGDVMVCIVDHNGSVVWQEKTAADRLVLQDAAWFAVKQQIIPRERYFLRISAENMTGSLLIASIDSDKNSKGIEQNALKNEVELEQPLAVQTTFYVKLGVRARILIVLWAMVIALLLLKFEKIFATKVRSIISAFLLSDIF